MSFNTKLTDLLKTNPNFVDDEGELLLAAVQARAWKLDHELIRLLLSDPELKAKFFDEIDGSLLFNTRTFIEYITQKNFLDNSYTRFRNRIGLTIDGKYLSERGEVSLAWAYKDCVLEGGQTKEEENRKEVFFNEVLAQDEINRLYDPKVLTNFIRYTTEGAQSVTEFRRDENGVIRENLIIKGNNLIALHTLKSQLRSKVKLIYIDPPYNTGNDEFGYNDNFNRSAWLTFMRNRLLIAREFLIEDGMIFIQIDYRQLAYLKVILDEIFGEENFIGQVNWQRVPEGRTLLGQGEANITIQTEYLLIYAKNKNSVSFNKSYKKLIDCTELIMNQYRYILRMNSEPILFDEFLDQKGEKVKLYKVTDYSINPSNPKTINEYLSNYEYYVQSVGVQEESSFQQKIIQRTKDIECLCIAEYTPMKGKRKGQLLRDFFIGQRKLLFVKDYSLIENNRLYRESDINDFWSNHEIQVTDTANEGNVTLRRGKKPESLLHRIIKWGTLDNNSIIMDFFSGSGTTSAVAHKLGYQYIGIEQLAYYGNDCVTRLNNVINGDTTGISKSVDWIGGGDFIYCELMKYNQAFLDRIQDANNSVELLQIWQEMAENSFLNWYVNPKFPEDAINTFMEIGKEENGLVKQKKLLMELLDKNQLYVNLSEIDDVKFSVSDEDKALNKAFYGEN
jgi:adenine-specific DNA-methyltransferase